MGLTRDSSFLILSTGAKRWPTGAEIKLVKEDEKLCAVNQNKYHFRGKIVLVAALDGTFQRLPFPEMLALVPLAEAVTKLQAVCMVCFQVWLRRLTSKSWCMRNLNVSGGSIQQEDH